MQFTYDINNKLVQPKLILANPQKQKIGLISGAKNLVIKPYFSSISELTFKIYKFSDGKQNKYYDKIVEMRLIEARYISWFQIKSVNEKQDIDSQTIYKEVTCLSLENELIYKKIGNVEGVYSLLDNSDTSHSLLHIASKLSGWNIGSVDQSLLGLYRMLSVNSDGIYNFLTGQISKSFDCLFDFDTYSKSINVRKLASVGEMTNIIISDKNFLQEYVKKSDLDSIVTKMRVTGGVGEDGILLDIRSVNFGSVYIINIDYYLTTEWMSLSLINAYTAYKTKIANYQTSYSSAINQLKSYQTELTTLANQLKTLMIQQNTYEVAYKTYVDADGSVPSPSDIDYTLYQTALSNYNSMFPLITSKNTEISNKETQILSIQTDLNNISNELDIANNFTQEQSNELETFLYENEPYIDETFTITANMTETEIIDLKLQLLANAKSELARVSRPKYVVDTTISNLLTIINNKDSKISYQSLKDKFAIGNMITLKFRENFMVGIRLMSMVLDFENQGDLSCTFSDKSRLDDELIQLAEILAQSNRTSTSVSLNKFGWGNASSITSDVRSFMNDTFTATKNKMASNDNQEMLLDQFGLHMRKFLPDQNKYSDYASWWNNYNLLFTSNNWVSSSTAIGLLTAPDGQTYYGVATDVLIGNLIMGEKLVITNSSGNYSINNSGFTASSTIGANTYSVAINPSSPTNIFNIAVNGVSKFYVDVNTNQLVMNGYINATGGTLQDLTVLGTITGGTFSGSNFVGATGSFSGSITSDGSSSPIGLSRTVVNNGYITSSVIDMMTFSGGSFNPNLITRLTSNGVATYLNGTETSYIYATGDAKFQTLISGEITCTLLNNSVPLTVGNLAYQCSLNNITVPNASYANNVNSGGSIGLFTISSGGGYISYAGASKDNASGYVYIGSQTLQAATIEQISIREAKDNIVSFAKNATEIICNTPIRNYILKNNTEDTRVHTGVIIDEAPEDIIGTGGKTISLYDMVSLAWKSIQEQSELIKNQKLELERLNVIINKYNMTI